MRIGIVPTKYGYSAVALGPYKGDWKLQTPVDVPEDLLIQIRSQILHKLSEYCHNLRFTRGRLVIAIPWAAWSFASLALCSLWDLGIKYTVLYGWIRFFFFGDGICALTSALYQLPGFLRVRQISQEAAKGEWVTTRVNEPVCACDHPDVQAADEREYLMRMRSEWPDLALFYNEMLRAEPPLVFSVYKPGLLGLVQRMFLGPRFPRPCLVFELGRL